MYRFSRVVCSHSRIIGFALVMLSAVLPSLLATPSGMIIAKRSANTEERIACNYRGTLLTVGQELIIDECTTCTCEDEQLSCEILSCPAQWCTNPLDLGECCSICPYYAPIWEVVFGNLAAINEGVVNAITLNLTARINSAASDNDIVGQGLWKASAWASASSDGEGNRISFRKQVLSENQASTTLSRRDLRNQLYHFKAFNFTLPNVEYTLNATGYTCSELQYMCVEFAKGDNPQLYDTRLPFTVEGVVSGNNTNPAPGRLRACKLLPACKATSCIYRETSMVSGESLKVDACKTCYCNAGSVTCEVEKCSCISCSQRVHPEGECCDLCAYYVPVWNVGIGYIAAVTEGKVNEMNFNFKADINQLSTDQMSGQGLWKLSVWASASVDGTGERISFVQQALTEDQAATKLVGGTSENFGFSILDIVYSLNATHANCSELQNLCVEFAKGDNPLLQDSRLPFTIEGVVSKNDDSPAPDKLRGCRPFRSCEEAETSCNRNSKEG